MSHPNILAGALLILGSELMFASMGATVKLLSGQLSSETLVFFRNAVGVAILAPWLLRKGVGSLLTRQARFHLLRAVAGLGAMYCFYYAIAHMQLAEAMLLKMTAPLFLPVVALLWLGEPVPARVGWAVILGFVGVGLILRPGFDAVSPVALVALAGGGLAAVAKVSVRRLSHTEDGPLIVFYFALVGTIVSSVPLFWAGVVPRAEELPALLAVGALGTAGQLLMTRGYTVAPAARAAPFTYASVLFASAYGWLFWDELLSTWSWVGAALVVSAGIWALRRARSKPLQEQRAERPSPVSGPA